MLLHKLKEKRLASGIKFAQVYWAALFLGLLGLQSCADYFFPEFKVEDSALEEQKALVTFSANVNPTSAMKNFLFAEDDKEIEGRLDFCGNKLFFYPKETISPNHCYKITVYSGAQDENGNTLQTDYKKIFYTKDDLTSPCVAEIKTIEDSDQNTEGLSITFNKAINQESFCSCFSLEPSADYFANWSDDKKSVLVKFKKPLLERTLYSTKIEKSLLDTTNNAMENDFYWSWTNKQDANGPSCKVYAKEFGQEQSKEIVGLYENADFSKEIEIVFDKKVLADSVLQGIKIEPQTSFTVQAFREESGAFCKKAKIIFNERIKWNSERTLVIKSDIKDSSGLSVEPKKILIKNNSELARPPKLECAALVVDGKNYYLTKENNFESVVFPIENYPTGNFKELPIYFIFSISPLTTKIDKISAYEGISVLTYGAGTINLNALESMSQEDFVKDPGFFEASDTKQLLQKIKQSQNKLCAIKYSALFKNTELNEKPAQGLIEFFADEKICDDKKNFMEESVRLTCNKI
ncbi:MAG: Ig-like domain-containing protein [Treponema sp.]|nr:Ig-like domain-containing protein [Treponema sp.]